MFSLFLTFGHDDPAVAIAPEDRLRACAILGTVPGARRAVAMTPALAQDRYHAAVPAPTFAAQLHFEDIAAVEAAIAQGGPLTAIAADSLSSLAGTRATHQVMVARPFPVPPGNGPVPPLSCAFMVHYPGQPQDLDAWLDHYLSHHPAIMASFPGIREIEVYTRADWVGGAPWGRAGYFQRNKVVFDTPEALEQALNSPARDRMRDDFANFPPFEGGSVHIPMVCERIVG